MQCPTCSFEAPAAAFGDPLRCPDCGAFYEKAVALQQRKLLQGAAQPVAQPQGPARAVPVQPALAPGALKHGLYCPSCGAQTYGKTHTRGSVLVELVLWLAFLIPGLIYSMWRLSTRQKVCTVCEAPGLIPLNSPKARQALGR